MPGNRSALRKSAAVKGPPGDEDESWGHALTDAKNIASYANNIVAACKNKDLAAVERYVEGLKGFLDGLIDTIDTIS